MWLPVSRSSVACMDVLLGLGVRAKKAIRSWLKGLRYQKRRANLRSKKQRAPAMSNLQVEIEEYFDQLWQPDPEFQFLQTKRRLQ
uniref:Uncharacterized protein n=1 Tax=Ditylenchus dipsaci TaxID=166011 RepID=A0A915E6L7_9BILA